MTRILLVWWGGAVVALGMGGAAAAAAAEASRAAVQPTASVTVSERYDSNVMLQERGALQHVESWVTSVQPVLGGSVPFQGAWPGRVSLQYSPDFTFFHGRDEESYGRHLGVWRLEGKSQAVRATAQVRAQYTDGTTEGPIWGTDDVPGVAPALGAPEVRNRRRNFYWQSPLEVRYDTERVFAGGVFEARVWDFMAEDRVVPGAAYQNYVDRTDVMGGPEVGLKLGAGWEPGVGYRFGHQDQEQHPFLAPYTYQNDYHRVVGVWRATPWSRFKLSGEAGSSFHQFNPASLPPGAKAEETVFFYSLNLTVALGTNTVVRGQAFQHLLPSSGGRATFQNIRATGTLEHRWSAAWRTSFRFDLQEYDMLRGSDTRDQVYVPEVRADYTVNRHLSVGTWYAYEWASNLDPGTRDREYDRHVVGVSVRASY